MTDDMQNVAQNENNQEIELEKIESEEEDSATGRTRYELFTYPADFTLEVLNQKYLNGEIGIPPMQRRFVWTQNQGSKLIESFLLGLPVPPIFLYAEKKSEQLMVVDGQQRLKSITYFFKETFGDEKAGRKTVFRLRLNEESPYFGKTFTELSEEDQRLLKRQVLRSFVMKQVNPEDNSSIFHVFERLNTGGTQLTNQEVRNCVYDGELNRLLHQMNGYPSWRKIIGKEPPDKRFKDIELILRLLALHFNHISYYKPMRDFLTDFMKDNRTGLINRDFEKLFKITTDNIYSSLGARPFHIISGLNVAVFDAVSHAFSDHLEGIPEDILKRFITLKSNDEFKLLCARSTTDVENVNKRLSLAEHILFGGIDVSASGG
jgi:hypothetical protein